MQLDRTQVAQLLTPVLILLLVVANAVTAGAQTTDESIEARLRAFRSGRQNTEAPARLRVRQVPAEEETEAEDAATTGQDLGAVVKDRPVVLAGIVEDQALALDTLQHRAEAQLDPEVTEALVEDELLALLRRTEDAILSEWTMNTVLALLARQQGIEVTRRDMEQRLIELAEAAGHPGDPQRALSEYGLDLESYIYEIENAVLAEKLVYKAIDASLDESELRRLYEMRKRDFTVPTRVRVRAIVKDLRRASNDQEVIQLIEEMDGAARQLRRGVDFAKVASEVSDAPVSRKKGGDLGWLEPGNQLPEPFNERVFNLVAGRPTDVLQSADGSFLYIFLVEEKRSEHVKPFEEARDELKLLVFDEFRERLYLDHRRKFRVILNSSGIDERYLEDIDLSQLEIF